MLFDFKLGYFTTPWPSSLSNPITFHHFTAVHDTREEADQYINAKLEPGGQKLLWGKGVG